jgi:FXSXX-COOH protein
LEIALKATHTATESLVGSLSSIAGAPLGSIPAAQAARVRRRIVDKEAMAPRLDYAAFNSAPTG